MTLGILRAMRESNSIIQKTNSKRIQSYKAHTKGRKISGIRSPGKRSGEYLSSGNRVSVWEEKSILEVGSSDS